MIGPPVGIDALLNDDSVEPAIEPGPVEMGPGEPLPDLRRGAPHLASTL